MNEIPKSKKMSGLPMDFTITPPKLKPKQGINLLLLALKPLTCILGPLTVPTIVYGVEGCTTTFWWLLGIALFTSLLLLTFDIEKAKSFIAYSKINQYRGIRCLIKASLVLLVCGGGIYAYHIHFYEIFSVCLFVTGVIIGTFTTDITAYWSFRRNKNLPYVNFTKNSPKPVRPSFLDLRRKSFNVIGCGASNPLPLKRQLSSPTKKSSNFSNGPILDEARTPNISIDPTLLGYPSLSSSSGESDAGVQQQVTPTKRRVISAGLISLTPLADTSKTLPISKKRLEFSGRVNPPPLRSPDISYPQTTPTFTYTECDAESLLLQDSSFFYM